MMPELELQADLDQHRTSPAAPVGVLRAGLRDA